MNVTLYTFSKRPRSTKRPTGGQTFTCTAKAPFNILSPSVVLSLQGGATANPYAWNYAYISDFDRYYRINDWTNNGQLWTATMTVDALASWKNQIGANSVYVYRSAYSYDGRIVDTLYPTIARYRRFNVSLPKIWSVDGALGTGVPQGYGLFVLGIVGHNQTRYYGMTAAQVDAFMAAIYDDAFYSAILGEFGATEYPEAKVAINPLQYISSIRFYPMRSGYGLTSWALHFTATVSAIPVGPVSVTASAVVFTAAGNLPDYTSYNASTIDIDISGSDFIHPQADDRGTYLQLAPYTSYDIFMPPWGLFQLDPADLVDVDTIRVEVVVDVRSGTGVLSVYTIPSVTTTHLIARTTAQVGIDCPLSAIVQPGVTTMSTATTLLGAAASAFMGNIGGAITGVENAIGDAVKGQIPHLSVVGSQGSGAAMGGSPCIPVTHRYVTNDDLSGRGRPLCDIRTLSAIPGYIKADPDELSIPCTSAELSEIQAAVAAGFYYE